MSASGVTLAMQTGQDMVRLASAHVGEQYVLGVLVPKDLPTWTGPWDCSEFASWLVFQVGTILYGCDRDRGDPSTADAFTGYWHRDAIGLGQIISIETAASTPGAAILRIPQAGATGHIVISDGNGGTVEAHSSRDGIIQSVVSGRRWDMGILVPGINYEQGPLMPISPPPTTVFRLTIPMMIGDQVRQIQQALKSARCDPGVMDGQFGPHTHAAVVAFQLLHSLLPDGEVGPTTAAELGLQL